MNKDKMELEEAIEIVKEIITHKEDFDYAYGVKIERPYAIGHEKIKAIETVLQALEKITEERNDYRSQLNGAFDNGFIPKKKIEDKIKAYEKLIYDISESEHYSHEIPLYKHDIQVLQELLEDK